MSEAEYVPQAWRMTDYYPDSYAKFMSALGIGIDYDDADFDRYRDEFMADLSEHDRQVAERAWDQGAKAMMKAVSEGQTVTFVAPHSPYRAAKGEQK